MRRKQHPGQRCLKAWDPQGFSGGFDSHLLLCYHCGWRQAAKPLVASKRGRQEEMSRSGGPPMPIGQVTRREGLGSSGACFVLERGGAPWNGASDPAER